MHERVKYIDKCVGAQNNKKHELACWLYLCWSLCGYGFKPLLA